jgi:hypothetical protein
MAQRAAFSHLEVRQSIGSGFLGRSHSPKAYLSRLEKSTRRTEGGECP